MKAVKAKWDRCKLETQEARAEFAKMMLGPKWHNHLSRTCPFLWAASDNLKYRGEDPGKSGVCHLFKPSSNSPYWLTWVFFYPKGGLLLGHLVAKVLGGHLSIINSGMQESKWSKKLGGALVLAIQAVSDVEVVVVTGSHHYDCSQC